MFANTIGSQTRKSSLGWGWVGGVGCLAPLKGSTQVAPPTRPFHPYKMSLKTGIELKTLNASKHGWGPNSQKCHVLGGRVGGVGWLAPLNSST